jgi:DNA processing protein
MDNTRAVLSSEPVSPVYEMGAYEALWNHEKSSFRTIAKSFREQPGALPSELVTEDEIATALSQVHKELESAGISDYGIRVYGSPEYPQRLRDAAYPVELLYYRGWWDLVDSPKRIAIVGSRKPTDEGVRRARKLVRLLVKEGYTIISGLAQGIDTVAHRTAIEGEGATIAVLGTPITEYYPPENRELQDLIGEKYLLISQIPIWRYAQQDYRMNRLFFPERNVTMSALAQGTVIVEASDTSGTLVQARAALAQGRKLFILDSCFRDPELKWPSRFAEQGAIRVESVEDIKAALA